MSKHRVSLVISGIPAPKGSKDVYHRRNGSAYVRESSAAVGPWVEQVAYCARANLPGGKPLEPPYAIALDIRLPEPTKPKYPWPSKDGDIDKLERAILDGLVRGGLLLDDRHVVDLHSRKSFGVPGVTIAIA